MQFVRYGGLSSKKQAAYGKQSMHAPPCRRGIYAFPWPYVNFYLLSGLENAKGKDKSELPFKEGKLRLHPKKFAYSGELWHHFGCYLKPEQILAENGAWVKSSVEDFKAALDKDRHEYKKQCHNSPQWHYKSYAEDFLEVFIEKV